MIGKRWRSICDWKEREGGEIRFRIGIITKKLVDSWGGHYGGCKILVGPFIIRTINTI